MSDRATSPAFIVAAVVSTAMFGLVGLLVAAEGALLLLPVPQTVRHQSWRLLALVALTTGLIAGLGGGAYFGLSDMLGGRQGTSQSLFGFFEGGILFGAPGLLLGALVGSVVAIDHERQARRQGRRDDVVYHYQLPR